MIKIILPLPNPKLSPNARLHWSKLVAPKKVARKEGYIDALIAFGQFLISKQDFNANKDSRLKCDIIAFFGGNKHMDDDNLLAALKSYQDGIFLFLNEKSGINDKQIVERTLDTSNIDKKNPRIEYVLSVIE